ncbi:hypothetical protein CBL_10012 [Carabus blaptoides fortunei]
MFTFRHPLTTAPTYSKISTDSSVREMTNNMTSPPTTEERTRSIFEADISTADEGPRTNHALSACGTDVSILHELTRLRSETDSATKHIIDIALQADTVSLDHALQAWMCEVFPPCRSTRQQKRPPKNGRRGPPVNKIIQTTRKHERVARYKKCQDLFRHKRRKLVHDIIDGKSPSYEDVTPSIQAVEELTVGFSKTPHRRTRNLSRPNPTSPSTSL